MKRVKLASVILLLIIIVIIVYKLKTLSKKQITEEDYHEAVYELPISSYARENFIEQEIIARMRVEKLYNEHTQLLKRKVLNEITEAGEMKELFKKTLKLQNVQVLNKRVKMNSKTSIRDFIVENINNKMNSNAVFLNVANNTLTINGGEKNNAMAQFARANEGVEIRKGVEMWKDLKNSEGTLLEKARRISGTVAISSFNNGYIIHAVGPKISDTSRLGLQTINDIFTFMVKLYIRVIKLALSKTPEYIILTCVFTDISSGCRLVGTKTKLTREKCTELNYIAISVAISNVDIGNKQIILNF